MRIAIISDTHDNIWVLDRVIEELGEMDAVIHCGDLCSPFVVAKLGAGLPGTPIHIVWGNNDGDLKALAAKASEHPHVHLHGHFANLILGGRRIGVNHYPETGRALADRGEFDLVCYGHDHVAFNEKIGKTLLVNPGELFGLYGTLTYLIYDTVTGQINRLTVQE